MWNGPISTARRCPNILSGGYYGASRVCRGEQFPIALNLALLLATCPEKNLRRPTEAVRLAEYGRRMMAQPDINPWLILATVYSHAGRFQAAAETSVTK